MNAPSILRGRLRAALLVSLLILAGVAAPAMPALALQVTERQQARLQADFRRWLQGPFRQQALKSGVPTRVFDTALEGVRANLKLPDLVLPRTAPIPPEQRQAEFSAPARYFNERGLRLHARRGRKLYRQHARLLRRIEKRFGVPGEIVLAIWARESNYGRARIVHDAFAILATQAWLGRRKDLFRHELLVALKLVASGEVPLERMKSSWAGALGQPQMMPSDFLEHAVDFDGDGRRDIWRSVPDVLASIANHLARHGWRRGVHWGVEVKLPKAVPCHLEGPDQGRPLRAWVRAGITRIDGRPFPRSWWKQKAIHLLTPAGRHGPVFLVSRNFHVLKDYNTSDLYALFVGHLGDRITGRAKGPFATRWQDVGRMSRADVARIQRVLERLGHDVGGVDGLLGFKTRRSIGRWQEAAGMFPTCFPTPELKRRILARR